MQFFPANKGLWVKLTGIANEEAKTARVRSSPYVSTWDVNGWTLS